MARFYDPKYAGFGYFDGTVQDYAPVWSGTGLVYTGTPAIGSYVKLGKVVQVQIEVIFADVSDFGSGQYYLTLPINSAYHTDVYGGSIHKTVNQGIDHYSIKGHLDEGSSLFSIWSVNSASLDEPFDFNSPVNIENTDKFHMSFSYICE